MFSVFNPFFMPFMFFMVKVFRPLHFTFVLHGKIFFENNR